MWVDDIREGGDALTSRVWQACDWCGGRVLKRAERQCERLVLDRVPAWACESCLEQRAYGVPPGGDEWVGWWPWGRTEPDWNRLGALRSAMIADLRVHGVDRVEFVVGFSAPFAFWVWLGTRADGERDALATRSGLDGDVGRLARTAGLGLLYLGVEVESQETVDRDYEGNWFYRLR